MDKAIQQRVMENQLPMLHVTYHLSKTMSEWVGFNVPPDTV